MDKLLKLIIAVIAVLFFAGCSNPAANTLKNNSAGNQLIIKGKAEFEHPSSVLLLRKEESKDRKSSLLPLQKGGREGFSSKATLTEVGASATVSLIYPYDHINSNKTIATGLTDAQGSFFINPSVSFVPQVNDIFVLEAQKRIGDTGNNIMTIRTFVSWNGNGWDSVTTPGISINSRTTAVTIITDYDSSVIPADTIGKIDISSGTSVIPQDIGNVTSTAILALADKVTIALAEEKDPFHIIRYLNNEYVINKDQDIGKLISSGSCEGCYLSNVDLSQFDLRGVNLSRAVLQGKDLSGLDFTGAIMAGANLESCIFNNSNFTNAILTYANLEDNEIENGIFVNADLSHSNLKYSYFINSDFTNADLSFAYLSPTNEGSTYIKNTGFSGAKLLSTNFSGAKIEYLDEYNGQKGFSGQNFSGADFSGTTLIKTDFLNCNLNHTNFSESFNSNVNFTGSKLLYANLSDAIFREETKFDNADLSFAKMANQNVASIAPTVSFKKAYLEHTDFSEMNFNKDITTYNYLNNNSGMIDFSYALFYSKELSNKDLAGINFSYALFSGANFYQSNISAKTEYLLGVFPVQIEGAEFTKALVEDSVWIDGSTFGSGHICGYQSYGICR